jgi:hypothetical protein
MTTWKLTARKDFKSRLSVSLLPAKLKTSGTDTVSHLTKSSLGKTSITPFPWVVESEDY